MPHILAIRPQPPGYGSTIAFFDVQITDDIRLFNVKLVQGPYGRRVHAASAHGSNTATFAPALSEKLMRAASAALGEPTVDRAAA